MNLEEPEPSREQKRTFLVVYSNPDASEYLHWLKRSTDHHELALDFQPNIASLADLVTFAQERAKVAVAVGSEFDEVWIICDGSADASADLLLGKVKLVTNTPSIAAWLDLHAIIEAPSSEVRFAGRYNLAKQRAKSGMPPGQASSMYLLVDALLESLRAFRGLDAPPQI